MSWKYIVSSLFPTDYYSYSYSQANDLDNAVFINNYPNNKFELFLEKKILRSRFSPYIPRFVKNIFVDRRIRYIKDISHSIGKESDSVCFLFFAELLAYEKYGFSRKLREAFSDVKISYYYQDLINSNPFYVETLKYTDCADKVFSFDCNDSKNYGFIFHNFPVSPISKEDRDIRYDLFFCGLAKNRLAEILDVFDFFDSHNVNCYFLIVGAPKTERRYESKICYCDQLSYEQYIDLLKSSKCILEVMQKGGSGNTMRVPEAIMFRKKLLTNNSFLKNNSSYNPNYMRVFKDASSLTQEEIDFVLQNDVVDYGDVHDQYLSAFLKEIVD